MCGVLRRASNGGQWSRRVGPIEARFGAGLRGLVVARVWAGLGGRGRLFPFLPASLLWGLLSSAAELRFFGCAGSFCRGGGRYVREA